MRCKWETAVPALTQRDQMRTAFQPAITERQWWSEGLTAEALQAIILRNLLLWNSEPSPESDESELVAGGAPTNHVRCFGSEETMPLA